MGEVSMLMLLIGAILVLNVTAYDEAEVMHITGKVLCQDCSLGYTQWISGSTPIKGSIVSVTCIDKRKRVMCYNSDTTDEEGQYDVMVKKFVYGKEVNPRWCTVRLVYSPDASCNVPTNFGHGIDGVKLLRPTSVYRDLVKFVLPSFYYTTPMCVKPDTSTETTEPKY